MAIYSVTHNADLDGIASAAMLVRRFGIPLSHVSFVGHGNESAARVYRLAASAQRGDVLIVTDLGLNKGAVAAYADAVKELKRRDAHIIWIDHHHWNPDALAAVGTNCDLFVGGENTMFCAAELVYKLLCAGDNVSARLARITHFADFNLKTRRYGAALRSIAYAITYANFSRDNSAALLRHILKDLADGALMTTRIARYDRLYRRKAERNIAALINSTQVLKCGVYRIGIGFGRMLQSTAACAAMTERFGLDIAVFVDTQKAAAKLRSVKGVSALALASEMGGGGHPQACGFQLDAGRFNSFDRNGRRRCVAVLADAASRVYA